MGRRCVPGVLASAKPGRPGALASRALALVLFLTFGSVSAAAYRLVERVDDLRWPWSLALLPDGSFLITEREGRLLRIYPNRTRKLIHGGPATLFAGQGGYFDILLDPSFEQNRLIYLSYAEGTARENGTAVFRARLESDALKGGRQILRVAQDKVTTQHYGGRMLMVGEHLLLTTGDGWEHREKAQSLDSELGKVLRVDRAGVPAGMPGPKDRDRRVWTYGHRNPQGLAYDAQEDLIYLHEHGPRGGDEVNLLTAGANYGWPVATHGVDYSGAYVSPFRSVPGMQDPLWTWTPSIAPSGMAHYRGSRFSAWNNSLLVGALVDRNLRRLQLHDGRVVSEEILFPDLNSRVRDVRVVGERIFVLTDGAQASLFEVQP